MREFWSDPNIRGSITMVLVAVVLLLAVVLWAQSLPQEQSGFEQYQQSTARELQAFQATQFMCSIKVFKRDQDPKDYAVIEIITQNGVPPDSIQVRYLNLHTDTWGSSITYKRCPTASRNRAPSVR